MCLTPSFSRACTTSRAPLTGCGWTRLETGAARDILCGHALRLSRVAAGLHGVGLSPQPRHMLSELRSNLLDRLGEILVPHPLIFALAGLVLGDPLARKGAALNVLQDLLHSLPGFVVDDART